jgi:phage baseplate assembly protein W
MDHRLADHHALRFPFAVGAEGGRTSTRAERVREQIEQVLMTVPGERVFRPEFGAGVKQMVFEGTSSELVAVVGTRLRSSLEEALRGEVDPKSLQIEAERQNDAPERLVITIRYRLATINVSEEVAFAIGEGD